MINDFLITLPAKIEKILEKINVNEHGLVFIVDKNKKLIGSISDGDIRRSILSGYDIKQTVFDKSKIVNKKIIYLKSDAKLVNILKILNEGINGKKIKCIPLVDQKKRVVDISTNQKTRRFPVAEPSIGELEIKNIMQTLKTGWISSQGNYVTEFENLFKKYLGGGHCIAVSSGTTALQVAISSLGLGRNDEIILPNFTFAATINSIINAGCRPVLVDVEKETWTINLNEIKKKVTSKTKAIMPVHIYGQPYKIDEIKRFAQKKNLFVIEDCAEAVGAIYKKRLVGLDPDVSTFSFFANKTITTGEGGMVVFKDKKIADKARILINHGMSTKKKYYHDYVGHNFRMTNMQAAIGVGQIKRINSLLKLRKKIFQNYDKAFKQFKSVELLPKNNWSTNSYWLYTLIIKNIDESKRDLLIKRLIEKGIECRPGFGPLNLMKPYKRYSDGKYPVSKMLSFRSISLPTSDLTFLEQNYIIKIFKQEVNFLKK